MKKKATKPNDSIGIPVAKTKKEIEAQIEAQNQAREAEELAAAEAEELEMEKEIEAEEPEPAEEKPDAKVKGKNESKAKKEKPPVVQENSMPDDDPLVLTEGKDFLVWIGYHHYPTIPLYIQETLEHGFAMKLHLKPKEFTEGETRIFLAHNEGYEGLGVIVGYVTPKYIKGNPDKKYAKRRSGLDLTDPNNTYTVGDLILFSDLINIKGEIKSKKAIKVDGDAILASKNITSSPHTRVTSDSKASLKKTKSRWDVEDHKELLRLVKENKGNTNAAFRGFAATSGRTRRSVEYQWYGPMKKAKMH